MSIALPDRVQNYKISATSPTEELRTIALTCAEVGDYAATILDCEHSVLAKMCASMLREAVAELIRRGAIAAEDDLFEIPATHIDSDDFASLTVDELYQLYRQWPARHQARAEEGREHCTFYFEKHIVKELSTRNASGIGEQLKIDYCTLTHANECENLSFIFSKPLHADNDEIAPKKDKKYTTAELQSLIRRHTDFRSITEREHLVEYVDYALDMIQHAQDKSTILELAPVLADLARNKITKIPGWVDAFIEDRIACVPSQTNPSQGSHWQ